MRNSHHGRRHYHCQDEVIPELAGAIFMCNNDTRKECFSRRIFGLPASRERFVRQVTDRMFLFLFDTDDRKMYGVFKATSNGDMNIVPQAFTSSGTTYPAQVPFEIISKCKPLTEREFKPAILEKYFTDVKFNFDLNVDQVQRLLVLFEEKQVKGVPQSITDKWDPSSSTDSPRYDGMSNTNTLSQTIHRHIRNPDPSAEVAVHFINSDINPHHRIDADVVNPDDQQVTLSAYNHPNLSSPQAVQLYDPDPPFPENTIMTVGACSDFYGGSLLNSEPQLEDVIKRRKSAFLRLSRNPQKTARETDPCQIGVYPTKNQPGHDSRAARQPRTVYNKQVVQVQEPVHIDRAVKSDRIGIELGPTAPVETQIRIVKNIKIRNGGSKLSIELKGDKKKRRLVRTQSMNSNTDTEEAGLDLDVVDTMEEMIPTAPVSNLTVGSEETQIPFVNFNRRNGGNKLIIEPNKGDEKKMGLIRPSLVSTASALDEESMVITDTMYVDAQTEVELVDTLREGFQGNHKGERVLQIANFSEGQPELPVLGEKTDEKKSVSNPEPIDTEPIIEIKDNSLCLYNEKSNLVEDYIPLEDYVALESHDENSKETVEYIEIADQEAQTEVELVLSVKTEEKKSVSNPEPLGTVPMIVIKDNLCLHNEKSNLVEDYIALESHNEKSNLVEDYIALEPEADKLEMDVFWFYQKSKAVEDYIDLESHDENSKEMVEYIELADQDYIPLE